MAIERRIVIGCAHSTYPADNINSVRVYDADLGPLWKYSHGALVRSVAMDADGNVYVGGAVASSVTTRKLDGDGAGLWSANHGGTVYAIAVGSDGAVVTGGAVASSITTRKYAANGTPGWTANHGAIVYCIAVDSSGNVYTGGSRYSASAPQGHIRKYNSSGTLQWTLDLGSSVNYAYGIAVDGSGNLYVTGYQYSSITTRKYNSALTLQWSVDDGGSCNALALDANGVYIAFTRNSSKSLRKRALSDGAEIWVADTGDTLHGVAVDAGGDVYAVSTADYTLYHRLGSDGTAVSSVAQSFQQVYAVAVADIVIPDLVGLPPGLSLPLALGVPLPTGVLRLAAGGPLALALGIPTPTTPFPPAGEGQPVYSAYLGLTPPLQLPLASFQCQRRFNDSTWLAMVLAGVDAALRAVLLSAVGSSVIVYAGLRHHNESETFGEFLRAVVTEIAVEREPHAATARITARIQAVLEPLQTRVMAGVHQYQVENGRRKIRCAVNPRLRPGDTIQAGAVEFVAHSIQYAISPASAWMEVQEAPNG